jgi:hypothetical protein
MNNPQDFRPKSGYFFAGITFLICGVIVIEIIRTPNFQSFQSNAATILWSATACALVYLVFLRTKITFFDEGVRIINPFDEFNLSWDQVVEVDTKWSLTFKTTSREISVWAAPIPGRHHARTIHETELRGIDAGSTGYLHPGESPKTHSGSALHMAKRRIKNFNKLASQQNSVMSHTWNWRAIVITSTLAILAMCFTIIHL